MAHELGVFQVWEPGYDIPPEASYVVAARETYVPPRPDINVILNWYNVHPRTEAPLFETAAELNDVEQKLKTIPTENFWGILFIREEHYRKIIAFNDDVDTTWFGERMLGFPLYSGEAPSATLEDWKDEMYLRMIRGFHTYFSPHTKVGVVAGWPSLYHPDHEEDSYKVYFGALAMQYIQANYDFVVLVSYSTTLDVYKARCEPYLAQIDRFFSDKIKIVVITRQFTHNIGAWEPEAVGVEMKNYLDRGCIITTYEKNAAGGYPGAYGQDEMWALMLLGRTLYDDREPYTETRTLEDDENLLTGYIGKTYGWVANPANDEDLYPTPAFPLGQLLPPAFMTGVMGIVTYAASKNAPLSVIVAAFGGLGTAALTRSTPSPAPEGFTCEVCRALLEVPEDTALGVELVCPRCDSIYQTIIL